MISRNTIFALSSGFGRAGIAVVRVSGPNAVDAIRRMAGMVPEPRRASVRQLHKVSDRQLIDQALVLWFPGPESATGEDVAEFHLHGSPAVIECVLTELSAMPGFVLAEAGAFSRRAFENGRLDLVEVEGLSDLLAAETESQRQVAMRQFSGEASSVYESWRDQLISTLGIIEASIDFADEDGVADEALAAVRPRLATLLDMLQSALEHSRQAAAVRRGLRIVIAGAPNVGKSSLLNVLVGRDAAIVSPFPGTTRDVVEAPLMISGVAVSLADTAGLRAETQDAVEREGMDRAHSQIEAADIFVWVTAADVAEAAIPPRRPHILVLNKQDIGQQESIHLRNESQIAVSAKTGFGIPELREQLSRLVKEQTALAPDAVMVRARHREAIEHAVAFLNDALKHESVALELIAEDVRKAALELARITGRVEVEEFLGRIFQEFCIGK